MLTSPAKFGRFFTIVVFLLAAIAVAGCTSGDSDPLNAAESTGTSSDVVRVSDPEWFSYDRPAKYYSVLSVVQVPMSSGGSLTCNLNQPGFDAATVAEGQFPTIHIGFHPYAVLNVVPMNSDFYAQRGYNVLSCDPRGTGRSTLTAGEMYGVWMSATELQDNYDLIEWAAAQSWSDGQVGQFGGSYGGGSTQRITGSRPPHLVAAVTGFMVNGYGESGSGYIYRGGAATTAVALWSQVGCGVLSYGCNSAEVIRTFLAHPLYDDFWKQSDYTRHWQNVDIPVLSTGSTTDTAQLGGSFENYVGLRKLGKANVYLIEGPYGHGSAPQNTVLMWFDHWLMNPPLAPLPPAQVTIREGGAGAQAWHELPDWPPADARPMTLHFTRSFGLSGAPGEAGSTSYEVPPVGTGLPSSGCVSIVCPGLPAGTIPEPTAPGQKAVFDSAPLATDTAMAGRPIFHLRAALTARDTIFVAKLYDVAEDGSATPVWTQAAYLKASHVQSHEFLTELTPGQYGDYVLEGFDSLWRFVKGHRIRVVIQGVDEGLFENAPAGNVTLSTGQGGSFMMLPVRSVAR